MKSSNHITRVTQLRIALLVIRLCVGVLGSVAALAIGWHGAQLVFRVDPQNDLRRGDALFVVGRYHDALATYTALTVNEPAFAVGWARRGMVETVRGETARADRSLATAFQLGLRGNDHDLARLYQGYLAANAGRLTEAESVWATIGADAPLYALRRTLEAERLIRAGDYAGAEVQFRAVSSGNVPDEWHALVRARRAALLAASNPDAARAMLTNDDQQPNVHRALLLSATALATPLLPSDEPSATALLAALQTGPAERPQLLGQVYLDSGLYGLAEAQFNAVAADDQRARDAAAYAAYTHWQSGERALGMQQLEALVAKHPDDPRARALLALTYVATDDPARAKVQLDAIRALAPRAPDTQLAWGQWYAAQHDYLAAADAYQRALSEATGAQRGGYALALARFSLDTDVQPCEAGVPAAEEATERLANDGSAWATLAGLRYRCGDARRAQVAAQSALARNSDNPEAAYYLGRALADLGDRSGARAALVSAADLAPASTWRERAEKQIALLAL